MTRVVLDRAAGELTLSGHAGSAEAGRDLVCAALSALCCTLELIPGAEVLRDEAFRSVSVPRERQGELEAIGRGFGMLAREFPRYVGFEERGTEGEGK